MHLTATVGLIFMMYYLLNISYSTFFLVLSETFVKNIQ